MNKTLILIITLLLIGFNCQGQKLPVFDITTGFGYPETFHLGIKIHAFKRNKFGLYYGNGLNFSNEYSYNSLTLDHQYHFGRVSGLSQRQIWFLRQGLSYGLENSYYSKINYLFLNLSIGREFYFSPKICLSWDLGLLKAMMEKKTIKNIRPWTERTWKDFLALPLIRMQVNFSP